MTRILMSRWLYNVHAIYQWSSSQNLTLPQPQGATEIVVRQEVEWWPPGDDLYLGPFAVGDFLGQGRTLSYYGLASATIKSIERRGEGLSNWGRDTPEHLKREVAEQLRGRPVSWYFTTVLCLVVWAEIMLAFMADFVTPTAGLGCFSSTFLFYGCLSSVTWFLQFVPPRFRRGKWSVVLNGCRTSACLRLCGLF